MPGLPQPLACVSCGRRYAGIDRCPHDATPLVPAEIVAEQASSGREGAKREPGPPLICKRCRRTFRAGTARCPTHGESLVPAELVVGPDGLVAQPLRTSLSSKMRGPTQPLPPPPRRLARAVDELPPTVVEALEEADADDERTLEQPCAIEGGFRRASWGAGLRVDDDRETERRTVRRDEPTLRQDEIEDLIELEDPGAG